MFHIILATAPTTKPPGVMQVQFEAKSPQASAEPGHIATATVSMPTPGTTSVVELKAPPVFELEMLFFLDADHVGVRVGKMRDEDLISIFGVPSQSDEPSQRITYAGTIVHSEAKADPCDVKCVSGDVKLGECCAICTEGRITTKICC
jgi:hypothetical protein